MNFHEHLQLVPVFRKDAADDDLLAQRRKSILHRGAELIKNAVGKTRKTADRGIDKTVTGGKYLPAYVLRYMSPDQARGKRRSALFYR